MKIERFIKNAVPYGFMLKANNERWFSDGQMTIKLPEHYGELGNMHNDNKGLKAILNNSDFGENPATLKRAYLPYPDSKASDIMRVFSDGEDEVAITNKQFGMIEKADMCVIATVYDEENEENTYNVLLIGKYSSIEDFEPEAIILNQMED